VGDRIGAELARGEHEVSRDDWTRQCRHQRVLAFVERVGVDRGYEEVVGELARCAVIISPFRFFRCSSVSTRQSEERQRSR
jgi:hypothetical protein